ncbi:MAG TPA: hypothetical protein DEB40_05945 [Elusimicrobia bacterium]|nr:hypothetical protein [Elusimicrobiota bacterium]HBT61268.1 hypothetical protein [Elusimicrobiota bacterium]
MRIKVRLFGHFIQRFGFTEHELEVSAPFTAAKLIARLGMEGVPHMMAKNGKAIRPSQRLKNGDRIVIAPIFSGG